MFSGESKVSVGSKFRLDQKREIGLYNEYLVSVSILSLSFYECHGYYECDSYESLLAI